MASELRQTIILTALPHGWQPVEGAAGPAARLKLGVFISPRLGANDKQQRALSDYADWNTKGGTSDWTKTVGKLSFGVRFGNAAAVKATPDLSQLNSAMWQTLFPPTQRVTPFEFENIAKRHGRSLRELSVGAMHEALRENYSSILGTLYQTARLPAAAALAGKLQELAGPATKIPVVGQAAPPPAPVSDPGTPLSQSLKAIKSVEADAVPPSEAPELDFHERVSLLADYPALLPMLGLVVNLTVEVPPDKLPPPNSLVSVHVNPSALFKLPGQTAVATAVYSPRTSYTLSRRGRFAAAPRPKSSADDLESPIQDGCLKLDNAALFEVVLEDAVGGVMKLKNAATNVSAEVGKLVDAPNPPAEQGLPALQNAGIQIIQKRTVAYLAAADARAQELQDDLSKVEAQPATKASAVLFADDLTLGYRLDVLDETDAAGGRWRSLHERIESYRFAAPMSSKLENIGAEGFTQPSLSASTQDDGTDDKLPPLVSDVLMCWDGWSLSARRPGEALAQPRGFETAPGPQPDDLRFRAAFKVKPGTLPRLRFNHTYRLRARTVDLSGYSELDPADEDFQTAETASARVAYKRFAPVNPPAVMYKKISGQKQPLEGESLERMVVRTSPTAAPSLPDAQTIAVNERFFAPPKGSQSIAELHEKFDGRPPGQSYELAKREYATLIYTAEKLAPGDTKTPSVVAEQNGDEVRRYRLVDGVLITERKEGAKVLEVIHAQTKDAFAVAYLPDPLSSGVFFRNLPGVPNDKDVSGANKIFFDGPYPDYQAFRLRLTAGKAGEASKTVNLKNGVLTVALEPGAVVELVYSSAADPSEAPLLGLGDWIVAGAGGKVTGSSLPNLLLTGAHPALTPYRKLTLVHAVKQPLTIPAFQNGKVTAEARQPGATDVKVSGKIVVDGASTDKVDVYVGWADLVDEGTGTGLNNTGLVQRPRRLFAGTINNPPKTSAKTPKPTELQLNLTHHVGDTRAREATYSAFATTAFREYFEQTTPASEFVRPTPAEQNTKAAAPSQATCIIKSTARPAAPKVLYAVPTFNWKEETLKTARVRTREGLGLRVYLGRPWHTSGFGEMLAVVLARPGAAVGEAGLPLVSQCGADPIHEQPENPTKEKKGDDTFLRAGDFPAADEKPTGLGLAELPDKDVGGEPQPGMKVDAAAFKVHFDPARELWYADLTFDPKFDYFPFLSLALACYQPNSEGGVKLSPVVRLDPVQVVPHRTATVSHKVVAAPPGVVVSVSVSGRTWKASAANGLPAANFFQAIVERLDASLGADFGWQPVEIIGLNESKVSESETTWSSLTLQVQQAGQLRLRIVEYELYNGVKGVSAAPPVQTPDNFLADVPGARLVYTDVFPLN